MLEKCNVCVCSLSSTNTKIAIETAEVFRFKFTGSISHTVLVNLGPASKTEKNRYLYLSILICYQEQKKNTPWSESARIVA
jgi:hypothetical protein